MPVGAAEPSGVVPFHRFLKNELLPSVEWRYRVNPVRPILFGQSRAGAMILYSAFTEPDLFWVHVASNPSWNPSREMFFGAPPSTTRKDLHLLAASGTNEYPDGRALAPQWSDLVNRPTRDPWLHPFRRRCQCLPKRGPPN